MCSLQLDWATAAGRLHGPTNCLPLKDGETPLIAFHKHTTSILSGLLSALSLYMLNMKKGSYGYRF